MIDLGQLGRDIAQKLDRRMQPTPSQPKTRIAAQSEGVVVANNHRVLNFTGPGVAVTDDPSNRRVNITIPGAGGGGVTPTVVYSDSTARALPLWNGSSNDAEPLDGSSRAFSNPAYTETNSSSGNAWGTAFAGATYPGIGGQGLTGWTGQVPPAVNARFGWYQAFTVPAGVVQSASLHFVGDDGCISVKVNGSTVHSAPGVQADANVTVDILPYLIAGTNRISGTERADDTVSVFVAFSITFVVQSSAGFVTNHLGADVAMPTANTFYDGPSVTVSAGSWLLTGTVSLSLVAASTMVAKLWDGTTVLASAHLGFVTGYGPISLSWPVSPTVTTTYKISVAFGAANGVIKAATIINGAGNNASSLSAVPI